jgi:hypothetical protein
MWMNKMRTPITYVGRNTGIQPQLTGVSEPDVYLLCGLPSVVHTELHASYEVHKTRKNFGNQDAGQLGLNWLAIKCTVRTSGNQDAYTQGILKQHAAYPNWRTYQCTHSQHSAEAVQTLS